MKAIAAQREWTGVPSTTQLLRGCRENWLTIKKEFSIQPGSKLMAIFGSKVHARLDSYTPEDGKSEERLYDGISNGAFDFYMDGILYDDKTYGSWSTMKTLGLKQQFIPNGHKPDGSIRWKQTVVPGRKNRWALAYQLNDYRRKLEKSGFPVHTMVCEILVRDGGTKSALERGITTNAMLVIINKISDHWIDRYMEYKAKELHSYLEKDEMPPPCRPKERWYNSKNGVSRKCQAFCDVRYICDFGQAEMARKK